MLTFSPDAQLVFFLKVFGPTHPVVERAKALLAQGVKFETSLYVVGSYFPDGTNSPLTLTCSTSALLIGQVNPAVLAQNKTLIEEWINHLPIAETQSAPNGPGAPVALVLEGTTKSLPSLFVLIKTVVKATGMSLADAAAAVNAAVTEGTPTTLKVFPTQAAATEAVNLLDAAFAKVSFGVPDTNKPSKFVIVPETHKVVPAPKPVPEVIALKDAQALGQKVHGTSQNSVYYCIAMTDHLKLAARLGTSISIRAEWTENPTADLKKLEAQGVQMKGGYGSLHFDPLEVPAQKVIGAFLLGTGIDWKQVVMNGTDLVVNP